MPELIPIDERQSNLSLRSSPLPAPIANPVPPRHPHTRRMRRNIKAVVVGVVGAGAGPFRKVSIGTSRRRWAGKPSTSKGEPYHNANRDQIPVDPEPESKEDPLGGKG